MAGEITRGTTFTLGQQNVDVATFIQVLTNATVANVDRDNVDLTLASLVTSQAALLDAPQASELMQDSLTHSILCYFANQWISALPVGFNFTLSIDSADVSPGDVIEPLASGFDTVGEQRWSKATTARSYFCAVVASATTAGGQGVAIRQGPVKAKTTGTVNAGEAVGVVSTAGTFESIGAAGVGYGPKAAGVAISAASGGYAWINLRK